MQRFFKYIIILLTVVTAKVTAGHYAVLSDSVRLYFEITGKGEPLLLIPGGPGDAHNYLKPFFGKLEKNFTVIYYDARGRGLSKYTGNHTAYSLNDDVNDIKGLCETLGLARIHVFGHSYGGMVAAQLACNYPALVHKLVLCNTFHSAEGWQENIDQCNRHIQESYPDQWTRLLELRKRVKSSDTQWRSVYDPCIESLYWYDISRRQNFINRITASGRSSLPAFSYDVYYAIIGDDPDVSVNGTMKDLDLRPLLKTITAPTLILTGRGDKIATVKQAVDIQTCIPNSRLHIFNISGHLPFVEEENAFIDIMYKFLKGIQ